MDIYIRLTQDSDYGKAGTVAAFNQAAGWQIIAAGIGTRLSAGETTALAGEDAPKTPRKKTKTTVSDDQS